VFEADPIDWWERSWGGFFQTFGDFLGFKWEVMGEHPSCTASLTIVVVDSNTGKAHIATRTDEIARFAKLIKTRYVGPLFGLTIGLENRSSNILPQYYESTLCRLNLSPFVASPSFMTSLPIESSRTPYHLPN
jgi:hypothetical protein